MIIGMIADYMSLRPDFPDQVGMALRSVAQHKERRLDVLPLQNLQHLRRYPAWTVVKGQIDDLARRFCLDRRHSCLAGSLNRAWAGRGSLLLLHGSTGQVNRAIGLSSGAVIRYECRFTIRLGFGFRLVTLTGRFCLLVSDPLRRLNSAALGGTLPCTGESGGCPGSPEDEDQSRRCGRCSRKEPYSRAGAALFPSHIFYLQHSIGIYACAGLYEDKPRNRHALLRVNQGVTHSNGNAEMDTGAVRSIRIQCAVLRAAA
ncbi:hypothetical protein D3C71_1333080 [compost metagenome]